MRNILKKLLEEISEPIITEKLAVVDEDVNLIYNKYFKQDFEKISETGMLNIEMFQSDSTDTSILTSDVARKCHELNPCRITINIQSNYYKPKDNLISFGVNDSAVDFILKEANGSITSAADMLEYNQAESLKREFKESTIKGSIHHELAHWIDDTLHNKHITNRLEKARETNYSPVSISTTSSKMEIEGQIHNIKQLKNRYENKWNYITFDDMVKLSPSLMNISRKLSTKPEIYKQWRRNILVRMHREGLLGEKMVSY